MEFDKVFKFRGKTLEELQELPILEIAKLLCAKERRKIKRGFTEPEENLLEKVTLKEKNIKTHARDMIVLPIMVGQKLSIHNGKTFFQVLILPEMIGFRLGALAPSKRIGVKHSGGNKK